MLKVPAIAILHCALLCCHCERVQKLNTSKGQLCKSTLSCTVIRFTLHARCVELLRLRCWLHTEAVAIGSELDNFTRNGNSLCVHIAWLIVQNTKSI